MVLTDYILENQLEIVKIYQGEKGELETFMLTSSEEDGNEENDDNEENDQKLEQIYCLAIVVDGIFYLKIGKESELLTKDWITYTPRGNIELPTFIFDDEDGIKISFLYSDFRVIMMCVSKNGSIDYESYTIELDEDDLGFPYYIAHNDYNTSTLYVIVEKNDYDKVYQISETWGDNVHIPKRNGIRIISSNPRYKLYEDGYLYGNRSIEDVVKSNDVIYLTKSKELVFVKIDLGIAATNVDNFYMDNDYIVYIISEDKIMSMDVEKEETTWEVVIPGGASYMSLPCNSYYDKHLSCCNWTKSSVRE